MKNVFIIAEAGVNHNGHMDLAYKLIDAAKEAGVDAIKFQTFKTENLVSKACDMADYQIKNIEVESSQYDMLKKLELSYNEFRELKTYCDGIGIVFLSTPFDDESLDFLVDELKIKLLKIPSGEIDNIDFLEKVAKKNLETILSTGMSTLAEVESAIEVFNKCGTFTSKLSVLHCTTNYPTPYNEVNLNAMLTIKNAFKVPIGYSDHTLGIEVPIAAVGLGAEIIEKHFTLDKNLEGPDHKASLDPSQLLNMVNGIRNIEKALGDGIKKPNESELQIMVNVRKSIVINKSVKAGHVLTEGDIGIKRPAYGIKPKHFRTIIGKKVKMDIKSDTVLLWDYIE